MIELTRPIVRYHGGKWMLANWITSFFPKHRCYVEPFGGGGSVLLRKSRSHSEVYNDLDGEIVNVFRMARDQGDELCRLLTLTPYSRDEYDRTYERIADPLEQARRTIARTFMGFGSNTFRETTDGAIMRTGFRQQSSGSGRTPARDWQNYPEALKLITERLQGVVIENRDAVEVMRIHDAETTLHYVDPPYVFSTRTDGRSDYRHELDDIAHLHLLKCLESLQGMVILSGYPNELYDDALSGWRRETRAAIADGGAKRTEVLWMRNLPANGELFPS